MNHWLKEPLWIDELFQRRKDDLFDWLSESASHDLKATAIELYQEPPAEFLVPPFFMDVIRPRLERSVPLALSRVHQNITFESPTQGVWWFDPEFPDQLWLGLLDTFPALLWVPALPDDAQIDAVYSNNFSSVKPVVSDLKKNFRMFAGTPEQLQMELENFENHYVLTSPVSSHMWGSEFEYDPWPESTAGWNQIDMIVEYRRCMVQRPGRVRRTSFRTSFSKSVLTVEEHPEGFVFDLRYNSSPVTQHVEAFNALIDTDYPTDAPADLVAAVLGFRNITAQQITKLLDAGDFEFLWSDLKTLGVVEPNVVAYERRLRRWLQNSDDVAVRSTIMQAAYEFGLDTVLYECWMTETDPELSAWLGRVLLPQEAV